MASGTEFFRVVDCFVVGDVYKLWSGGVGGTLLATSTFYAGAPTSNPAGGYESYWLNAAYSKLEYSVGPGSYSFTISGDGAGGIPVGFGVQLAPVPETETYALMLAGLAAVGFVARRSNC